MTPSTRDAGSAVVESTLVIVMLTTLFLGVLQVGLALYVRNTMVAAAAEGARYAANADRTPADGAALTADIIAGALHGEYAGDVRAGTELVGGASTVYVEASADLPVVGLWGPAGGITVRGHARQEAG